MSEPKGPRRLAVIGTAGRDTARPMTKPLWDAMLLDLHGRVQAEDTLISGGAAWADHLAVHAFLNNWVSGLQLFLPAPMLPDHSFAGGNRSSGSAANYYHELFSKELGVDTRAQIAEAITRGAQVSSEPAASGYGGMFNRNKKVALACDSVLAYTWGEGDAPADGGTQDTWWKIESSDKVHVSLVGLLERQASQEPQPASPAPRARSRAERFS